MGVCLTPTGPGTELDLFPWLRFFGNQCYKNLLDLDRIRIKLVNRIKANALRAIENGELEKGIVHGLVRAERAGNLNEVMVRQTMGKNCIQIDDICSETLTYSGITLITT